MRFKRLDLNLLVALDHLLELRSVTRAAEKMFMSQSAMSNALTRLREYFDDPLLVQVGRRMDLTPRAEAMRHQVRDVLVRIEATILTDLAFDPAESDREFGILASDYTATCLMPHVLQLAAAQNAKVRFRLLTQVEEPHLAIERGDASMSVAPANLVSANHPSEELFTDGFCCIAWRDGAHGSGEMTAERYLDAGHVVMEPRSAQQSFDSVMFEKAGVVRTAEVVTFNFASLPQLVVGTDRLATVHGHLARKFAAAMPITIHPLPFEFPLFRQHIQWHQHKTTDPAVVWLRDLMHAAVDRLEGEAAAVAAQ